jgi:hypothetical protein
VESFLKEFEKEILTQRIPGTQRKKRRDLGS